MSAEHLATDVLTSAAGEVEVRPTDDGVVVTTDTRMGLALSLELTPGQAERLARALSRAATITRAEVVW